MFNSTTFLILNLIVQIITKGLYKNKNTVNILNLLLFNHYFSPWNFKSLLNVIISRLFLQKFQN